MTLAYVRSFLADALEGFIPLHRPGPTALAAALVAALAAGCGGPEQELAEESAPAAEAALDPATLESPLVGGTLTSARPEIGQFYRPNPAGNWSACTATLIAPRYVLTAAHCLNTNNYQDTAVRSYPDGRFDQFIMDGRAGIPVDRIHSFSSRFEDKAPSGYSADMALLRLATPVPAAVATPAAIDGWLPSGSSRSTRFGYGCTDRSTQLGAGAKRYYSFTGNTSNVLCPGDSGGPAVFGEIYNNGAIWGVHSGYAWDLFRGGWFDVDADATWAKRQIEGLMHAWDGEFEEAMDRPGNDYRTVVLAPADGTASRCRQECLNDTRCRAYTLVKPGTWDANGHCFLKESVGELRPMAGAVSGLSSKRPAFTAETNVDRPGGDYRSFNVSNASECMTWCAQDWQCRAFSVNTASSPNVCFLKSRTPMPVNGRTGVVSGARRGLEMDTNRWGSDYHSFQYDNPSPELCQAECARDNRCRAWTYVPPDNAKRATCWLKNAIPGASYGKGLVSGVKWQEFY
jgi:hypothetical protein